MSDQLRTVVIDKHGPGYDSRDVGKLVAKMIGSNQYFQPRVKKMAKDLDAAKKQLDEATENFTAALDRMVEKEADVSRQTKKTTGAVRDAAHRLGEGLAKVEQIANLDRLEKCVELLERAERSFTALAELEKSGKLEKIADLVRT